MFFTLDGAEGGAQPQGTLLDAALLPAGPVATNSTAYSGPGGALGTLLDASVSPAGPVVNPDGAK